MNKQCKGCANHYIAGHPKGSPLAKRYNDWCTKHGSTAKDALGHCKLNNWKVLKNEHYNCKSH